MFGNKDFCIALLVGLVGRNLVIDELGGDAAYMVRV